MKSESLYGIIVGVFVLISFVCLNRFVNNFYYSWLVILNLTGYFIMAIDKKQSIKGKYRVPNEIIKWIALLGGPLGIFIGTFQFRHKSLMPRFKLNIGAILAVHILILFAIFTFL